VWVDGIRAYAQRRTRSAEAHAPGSSSVGIVEEDLLDGIVADFNAGSYRACVEPLEALYFDGRHPGHKGLLQLAVALLQLERGLTSGPRYLLASARRLLEGAGPGFAGLDTSLLLERIEAVQRWLDSDKRRPRPEVTLRRASDRVEDDGDHDLATASLARWLRRQLAQRTPVREHLEAAVANDDPKEFRRLLEGAPLTPAQRRYVDDLVFRWERARRA
jgi:hypothetical protein